MNLRLIYPVYMSCYMFIFKFLYSPEHFWFTHVCKLLPDTPSTDWKYLIRG